MVYNEGYILYARLINIYGGINNERMQHVVLLRTRNIKETIIFNFNEFCNNWIPVKLRLQYITIILTFQSKFDSDNTSIGLNFKNSSHIHIT